MSFSKFKDKQYLHILRLRKMNFQVTILMKTENITQLNLFLQRICVTLYQHCTTWCYITIVHCKCIVKKNPSVQISNKALRVSYWVAALDFQLTMQKFLLKLLKTWNSRSLKSSKTVTLNISFWKSEKRGHLLALRSTKPRKFLNPRIWVFSGLWSLKIDYL